MTQDITRRAALFAAAGSPLAALHAAPAPADSWLLIDKAGIEAAKARASRNTWAKAALDDVMQNAARGLSSDPNPPERPGQWPHWYSCKLDGVKLETVSPTEHRCPKCGTVYRGDPYDAVVLYGVHSRYSRFVRDLGLAFRFTGDAKYARRAGELLGAYAARYAKYPLHNTRGEAKVGGGRIMAQTLDESVWLIPVAWGYSLVRETLSPAERGRIENDLLVAAAEVIRQHRMSIHNIQCWKNSAMGCAGMASGRADLVSDAIDNPDRGFRVQIAKGVTDDGLWYEGSLGYHSYTMDALWPLAEAARLSGTDLYSDRLRSLWDAPLALAFPDGTPPGFNDNGGSPITRLGPLYELAYARWKRPEYGRVAAKGNRSSLQSLLWGAEPVLAGPLSPERSSLLRDAGFAMLRAKNTAAAIRFGMHGGGHGHPDKLNLVTWGAGKRWGLDPGSINYGVPLHQEWYRSTVAHNTVTVDGASQSTADGRLDSWNESAAETTLAASADSVYKGVKLSRTVKASASKLEDRFACSSDAPHTYDWVFHSPGRLTTSVQTKPGPEKLGTAAGYQHIEKTAQGQTDGDWWARWEQDGASLTLRFKAAPGTEVLTGAGPGRDPADRVPVLIVRRKAASTVFEAVHEFA
jgi:oligo-alginate lyase